MVNELTRVRLQFNIKEAKLGLNLWHFKHVSNLIGLSRGLSKIWEQKSLEFLPLESYVDK